MIVSSKKKHKEKLICFDEEFFQIIITVYMLGIVAMLLTHTI